MHQKKNKRHFLWRNNHGEANLIIGGKLPLISLTRGSFMNETNVSQSSST
ncbi:hypothetical protein Golob_015233 [Gossypium lobatum]|uniref:Uncharacterized protein n=1 Tax=Gossypium lobatum TaxID=34289 RepID=A0A7J8M0H6_9ROSI|nr:hypothetical protein [Gossypium lobatum]